MLELSRRWLEKSQPVQLPMDLSYGACQRGGPALTLAAGLAPGLLLGGNTAPTMMVIHRATMYSVSSYAQTEASWATHLILDKFNQTLNEQVLKQSSIRR